jgi:type VI secretion system protein ImpF
MSRFDNEVRITISVLDRLIDYEPELSREAVATRSKNLRQLKQAVLRDLEWLLNTRQIAQEISPDLVEVNRSVVAYGLPDFTVINHNSPSDQTRMRRAMEHLIASYEPRLEDVMVTVESAPDVLRTMRFRIDARLKVDPAPEPVTFDTTLHISSGQYTMRET